jgi:23S rRNA (adenine2030-N6)-methyltransferase
MNYRHIYHAGNFADVFKHTILCELLLHFREKNKPFSVLDTHAGIGLYDLSSQEAQKTQESQLGILKLSHDSARPDALNTYLDCVKTCHDNNDDVLFYPGSPKIIQFFLSNNDELHANELHPEDYQTLKKHFFYNKNIHIHHEDAYRFLQALLPLKHKRGLILIDPPFEKRDELQQLFTTLEKSLRKFPQGIYVIWLPIKTYAEIKIFYATLSKLSVKKILALEIILNKFEDPHHLNGSSMVILNPPWQFDTKVKQFLPYLANLFKENAYGNSYLHWIKQDENEATR